MSQNTYLLILVCFVYNLSQADKNGDTIQGTGTYKTGWQNPFVHKIVANKIETQLYFKKQKVK